MKELEDSFYVEDIAAAAIMLYAAQGGRREVRRRTLTKAPFIPLRTKETLPRSMKKLPSVQPQSRSAVQGTPGRSPPRTGPAKNSGGRPQGFKGQKGHGGRNVPQGKHH